MAGKPIKISIIGDDSKLKKTLSGAANRVESFGKNVAKVGFTAGAAFAGLAATIATKGVMAFADFEKGMNEVMTLLPGAAEGTFDDLSGQVKDFAKEFGVLPDEVIPSLYQALSAGVPKDNVFEFLEVAQMAALGGVTELETAVDGISSVVNAYGEDVIGATEASDLMFTAVRLGKTTFEEMSASLFQVAPIAASLGVDFGDVTASLANLTAMGVPTKVASVQMKGALAELAKEGTKADVAFRDLTGVGFTQFIEDGGDLQSAFMALADGAEASGVSVLDLFSSIEGGQAVLALTADGGEAFAATMDEMGGSAGATQAAYDTMDQGISRTFDKIKATLAVFMIQIGEKVVPLVETGMEKIREAFDEVRPRVEEVVEKIKEFTQTKEFKAFVEKVSKGLKDIRDRFMEVFEIVRDWIKQNPKAFFAGIATVVGVVLVAAVWGLVTAFLALLSPVVLIIAALALLVGAFVWAWENVEGFKEVVMTVVDYLRDVAWPKMKEVFEGIVKAAKDFGDFFMEYLLPIVLEVWTTIKDSTMRLWDNIKEFVALVKALFSGDFVQVWESFKAIVVNTLGHVKDLFFDLPKRLVEAGAGLGGKLKEWGGAAMGKLLTAFTDWWDRSGQPWFENLPSKIVEWATKGFSLIYGLGKSIGGWIMDGLSYAIGEIGDFLGDLAGDLWDFGTAIGKSLVNGLLYVWNKLDLVVDMQVPSWIPGIGGKGWGPVDLIPDVDYLAKGGIVNSPTLAMIGEGRESEAVVPLSRAKEFGFGGGGNVIHLTVNAGMGTDGLSVGNEIVSALKQWERANGSLPLNVSAG